MNEYVKPIIYTFPVWETSVWNELQAKKFGAAGRNLQSFLETFSQEEWDTVLWNALMQGIPAVRGEVSSEEWRDYMLPIFGAIVLNLGNGRDAANIYRGLDFNLAKKLHGHLLDAIPETKAEEKMETLKLHRSSLFMYLLASPAQVVGFSVGAVPRSLLPINFDQVKNQYDSLSETLKETILDYGTAEIIFTVGRLNHLSDEKISYLGIIIGKILAGLTPLDDLQKEIEATLLIDHRSALALTAELKNKILTSLTEEINLVYAPLSDLLEKAAAPTVEELIKGEVRETSKVIPLETMGSETGEISETPVPTQVEIPRQVEIPIQAEAPAQRAETPIQAETWTRAEIGAQTEAPPQAETAAGETAVEPLIIHEEKMFGREERPRTKGFLLPFKFFGRRETQISQKPPVKVKIETPEETERVVHYSELRTPLPAFGKEESISLESLAPFEIKEAGVAQPATRAETQPTDPPRAEKKEKKTWPFNFLAKEEGTEPEAPKAEGGPRLEGNIVDLRENKP